MRNLKPVFYLLAIIFVVVASAGAVHAKKKYKMKYRGLDTNKDGIIQRQEWNGSEESFQEHDWNSDGVLSGNEVLSGAKEPDLTARFDGPDREHDGIISRSEWLESSDSFYRLDDNHDGVLTRPEYRDATPQVLDAFAQLDSNRNGYITRSEWNGTTDRFNQLDDNRDGLLSRTEFF